MNDLESAKLLLKTKKLTKEELNAPVPQGLKILVFSHSHVLFRLEPSSFACTVRSNRELLV